MDATPEEWRPVVGYEGSYEVSNKGRVRSLDRIVEDQRRPGRRWMLSGLVLQHSFTVSGGYPIVTLYRDGEKSVHRINRLVLIAFVGDALGETICCHNDGDPSNNVLTNLRWDTFSENMFDVVRHGNHVNANKTHCPRGHEYAGLNLVVKPSEGRRRCKTCIREYQRRYRASKSPKEISELNRGEHRDWLRRMKEDID